MNQDPVAGDESRVESSDAERGAHPNPLSCFDRRYLVEITPAIVATVLSFVILWSLPRTHTIRILLLGLACGSAAWVGLVTVAAIRRLDELQQRLHLVAIAISFAATAALVAMNKFLLLAFGWSPSGLELWMVMMLVWGVGIAVLTHRYR